MAEAILNRSVDTGDLSIALGAIRTATGVMSEGRRYLELRGDLSGELGKRNSTPTRYTAMYLPSFYEAPEPEAAQQMLDAPYERADGDAPDAVMKLK